MALHIAAAVALECEDLSVADALLIEAMETVSTRADIDERQLPLRSPTG